MTSLPSLLAELPDDPLRAAVTLRKSYDAEVTAALMEARYVRGRAKQKFETWQEFFLCDRTCYEQATPESVARAKGQRLLRHYGGEDVWDLGAGAGADALGFLTVVPKVQAVEIDPVRTLFCRHNGAHISPLGMVTRTEDLTRSPIDGGWVHLDPARRIGSQRTWKIDDHLPPPSVWVNLLSRARGGMVKLAPSFRAEDAATLGLPDSLPRSLAFVSRRGEMNQTLLLVGEGVADSEREAWVFGGQGHGKLLGPQHTASDFIESSSTRSREGAFLVEPDPAVARAGLVHALPLAPLQELLPGLGWWLASEVGEVAPFAHVFRIIHRGTYNERRLREMARGEGIGQVAVKIRGVGQSAEDLARRFVGPGSRQGTLFLYRDQSRIGAILAEPVLSLPCESGSDL